VTYNDIRVFEDQPGVFAGYATRDCNGYPRREEMQAELSSRGGHVIWLGLDHTTNIRVFGDLSGALDVEGKLYYDNTDGAVTDRTGLRLTATSGDCMPVYMYDPVKRVIGLAHAGWKGVLGGMPARLCETMVSAYGCEPSDILAYIGPGIGACCFEIRDDVLDQFLDKYPWSEDFVCDKRDGHYLMDLKGIGLELIAMSGITKAAASPLCTCCRPDLFYSHRRDGDKRRMLAYIELI
jgi:YfiH family protein